MPADLHQKMSDEIARQSIGKKRKDQPSVDGFIQQAVAEKLSQMLSNVYQEIPDAKLLNSPDCMTKNNVVRHGGDSDNLDEIRMTVPHEFAPWIPKLIAVLSGPARHALEANLETFAEYTVLKGEKNNAPPPGNPSPEDRLRKIKANADATAEIAKGNLGKHSGRPRKRDRTA